MANPTTNYGFVLPTPTDLVTDLPADFDIALQGVDTRLKALQPGTTTGDLAYSSATANTNARLGIGTAGQILSVVSGVPAWVANDVGDITAVTVTSPITGGGTSGSVGVAIQDALTTQKGAVQLSDSVSTTSSVLAATSTAVKAANDNASKSTAGLAYTTGRYYQTPIYAAQVASTTYAANITYYIPFFVRETRSFAKIAILAGSAFVGTASIRLGIYNSTSSLPSTVVIDAGLVAPIAATTEYSITINQSLSVGWHFLAINTVTAATTNGLYSNANPGYNSGFDLGGATIIASQGTGYSQSVNASAGFATASSPTVFISNIPLVKLVA